MWRRKFFKQCMKTWNIIFTILNCWSLKHVARWFLVLWRYTASPYVLGPDIQTSYSDLRSLLIDLWKRDTLHWVASSLSHDWVSPYELLTSLKIYLRQDNIDGSMSPNINSSNSGYSICLFNFLCVKHV